MAENTVSIRKAFRNQPVLVVATTNPKKKGSMSYDRFQGYFDYSWPKAGEDGVTPPTTVQNLIDGGTVRMDDIKHDSMHGFIVVGQEAIDSHIAAQEEQKKADIEKARALLASIEAEGE